MTDMYKTRWTYVNDDGHAWNRIYLWNTAQLNTHLLHCSTFQYVLYRLHYSTFLSVHYHLTCFSSRPPLLNYPALSVLRVSPTFKLLPSLDPSLPSNLHSFLVRIWRCHFSIISDLYSWFSIVCAKKGKGTGHEMLELEQVKTSSGEISRLKTRGNNTECQNPPTPTPLFIVPCPDATYFEEVMCSYCKVLQQKTFFICSQTKLLQCSH